MRRLAVAVLFLIPLAHVRGADEGPKATRVIEGQKTTFPDKSISDGVKALVVGLESCHDMSDGTVTYTNEDIRKALKGDYVRFVFTKPIKVEVLNKRMEVSDAIFAGGVFWLLCGKDIVRCTKYEFKKMMPFEEWSRQTLPVD